MLLAATMVLSTLACSHHANLTSEDHIDLRVRIRTQIPDLAVQFRRALNFWASVLDLSWREVDDRTCTVELSDASLPSVYAAISFPATGEILFNRLVKLDKSEQWSVGVHELGHLLGLIHNPSPYSVMYDAEVLGGPGILNDFDIKQLYEHHKLRVLLH